MHNDECCEDKGKHDFSSRQRTSCKSAKRIRHANRERSWCLGIPSLSASSASTLGPSTTRCPTNAASVCSPRPLRHTHSLTLEQGQTRRDKRANHRYQKNKKHDYSQPKNPCLTRVYQNLPKMGRYSEVGEPNGRLHPGRGG